MEKVRRMYFKSEYIKYTSILILSLFIAILSTVSINSEQVITLSNIVKISNLYTLGSTGGLIQNLMTLL